MRIGREDMNNYAAGLEIEQLNSFLVDLRRQGLD
jgi:hypothetical protein